jgi:hypothetical protein
MSFIQRCLNSRHFNALKTNFVLGNRLRSNIFKGLSTAQKMVLSVVLSPLVLGAGAFAIAVNYVNAKQAENPTASRFFIVSKAFSQNFKDLILNDLIGMDAIKNAVEKASVDHAALAINEWKTSATQQQLGTLGKTTSPQLGRQLLQGSAQHVAQTMPNNSNAQMVNDWLKSAQHQLRFKPTALPPPVVDAIDVFENSHQFINQLSPKEQAKQQRLLAAHTINTFYADTLRVNFIPGANRPVYYYPAGHDPAEKQIAQNQIAQATAPVANAPITTTTVGRAVGTAVGKTAGLTTAVNPTMALAGSKALQSATVFSQFNTL